MRQSQVPESPAPISEATAFGAYTLLERIGVGGMAEVFRAETQPVAGAPRAVVIKRMLPHIAAEPGAVRMFEEEAWLGSRVEHPNVVRVLELGEEEGAPYLALELVPGRDLQVLGRWLRHQGRTLPPELVLFVATELLAGLHAVHGALDLDGQPLGIVHGDVSPSNVLVSTRGDVKLSDFGIAEARLRESFPQAAAGRTKGKLGYLSPEQVRGEPTDRRSDVFGAAVVIAELAIGEPLFARGTELTTLLAVRDAKIDPLLERADALPDGLVDALLPGLARDPEDRYEDAGALREALAALLDGAPAMHREALGKIVADGAGADPAAESTDDDAVTMEPPLDDYHVERAAGGEAVGPLTFAQLVEAVTMGRIAPGDGVRLGDGSPRAAREISELTGYFPDAVVPQPVASGIDIGGGELIDRLARHVAERASGVWVCERGDVRKEVYLIEGSPEFVSSNVSHEMLGEFLVEQDVLTRAELDMALAVLPRFEGRLGDTLAALGLIEPVELFRHIAAQVREKLLELFTWEEGTARFHEGVAPPQRFFPLGLDPWQVLGDGIERRLRAGLEQDRFAAHMMDDVKRTRTAVPKGIPRRLEQLLAYAEEPRALQGLVEAMAEAEDPQQPYRLIRLGLALGALTWIEEPDVSVE